MSYINNVSAVEMDNIRVDHFSTSSILVVTVKTPKSQLEDEHEDKLYLEYDEAINLKMALDNFIDEEV